ncbi:MAG: arginine--tRNA ligase [Chitinophagales bacterium]|nr:arginine--tRNA ligase [Bacteroidota bacterium]MBP7399842.1 arginine--tRNA ligase [Chitinophagales bacterium]MBP8754693.1 arginine--tRNA ligase [Chitinophagales bacterium]MBP9188793.1 arginine--tRNA ligase [Chitinophagales bacterium]MBP9547813.1 arginine--tRNA ligase [Chitinophagales bacterium]
MHAVEILRNKIVATLNQLYDAGDQTNNIRLDITPPEFDGDYTLVVFPFTKISRQNPELTANTIGNALKANYDQVVSFNVVKGFLNITLSNNFWITILQQNTGISNWNITIFNPKKIVVEYCGPNTNKPLHLGHVRNMLLGYSTANILQAAGNEVHHVNIYNDRGIAICKSMVAYLRKGNSSTPESTNTKGDHFVGKFYVEYSRILEKEITALIASGKTKEEAEKIAPIYLEATDMLRKWEAGDKDVLALWNTMNSWVYAGFNITYKKIGVAFEKDYLESENFSKGRDLVLEGLEKNIFYKKPDGSVWVDLTEDGLDEKVLLRSDGTSVYITQDIGVAKQRYSDFEMDTSVYVVANEQDYHFKVLKLVLQKLQEPYANGIYHLNYGMVDLPEGKMKSREGTVVDADELIDEITKNAVEFIDQSEKGFDFDAEEKIAVANQIGLGALKYFILKVDPKKRILFNPKESIDLQGNTGPFIQYTYARIKSILRKYGNAPITITEKNLLPLEKELIVLHDQYTSVIEKAAEAYSPADIANYLYALAKTFNKFYAEHSVLKAETTDKASLRISLIKITSEILQHGLKLLGIEAPEKM